MPNICLFFYFGFDFFRKEFFLKLFYYKKFLTFCFYLKINFSFVYKKRLMKICFFINLHPFSLIKFYCFIGLYGCYAINRFVLFVKIAEFCGFKRKNGGFLRFLLCFLAKNRRFLWAIYNIWVKKAFFISDFMIKCFLKGEIKNEIIKKCN